MFSVTVWTPTSYLHRHSHLPKQLGSKTLFILLEMKLSQKYSFRWGFMECDYFFKSLPLTRHRPEALCHFAKHFSLFPICFRILFTRVSRNPQFRFSWSYNVFLPSFPTCFSHLSNTTPLLSSHHPAMINLRIFSSTTACKSHLCFSYQLSSSFHISSALHCSMTIIYIYKLIHSLSTFSFESQGYHLLKSAEPQAVGLCVLKVPWENQLASRCQKNLQQNCYKHQQG